MRLPDRLRDRLLGLPGRTAARRDAQAVALGDGLMLCRALGRYKMFLPAADLSVVPHLLLDGRWEPQITRVLAERLRPGMTVADVGANVGYFTLLMADRVGAGGHVHAFEPNPTLVPLVARSLAINGLDGRVTLHPVPLGAEDGAAMRLVLPHDHLGGGTLWDLARETGAHPSHDVVVRRLDALPGAERIALAKIDAEGAEPAIWEGMAGLLAGPTLRTLVMEFTAGAYADPAGFLARIAADGFAVRRIDPRGRTRPASADAILAAPPADAQLLLLTR